jgi:hypothetical protein
MKGEKAWFILSNPSPSPISRRLASFFANIFLRFLKRLVYTARLFSYRQFCHRHLNLKNGVS